MQQFLRLPSLQPGVCWKQWKKKLRKVNDIAFNLLKQVNLLTVNIFVAFRELANIWSTKHGWSNEIEESVESTKIGGLSCLLKAGQDVNGASRIGAEFAKIKSCSTPYKASGDEKMRAQIHYWLIMLYWPNGCLRLRWIRSYWKQWFC